MQSEIGSTSSNQKMATILGIDAAWTAGEPSGVALVTQKDALWRCVAVAPSYESFLALANGTKIDWTARPVGTQPDVRQLLEAAASLAGDDVSVITIDMPVATVPIDGRRAADRLVSQKFGARGCSTHSPGPIRPGRLGAALTRQCASLGFDLAVDDTACGTAKRLVEVYPHLALLTLLNREYRVPYKVSKSANYWPGTRLTDRIDRLLLEFAAIESGLQSFISNISIPLPPSTPMMTLSGLKRFEDALDALICCWVGACYLERNATALGDSTGAIWWPTHQKTKAFSEGLQNRLPA